MSTSFPLQQPSRSDSQNVIALNPLKIDYHGARKAGIVLRALNNKIRQQILALLCNRGELSVSDIHSELRLEQSIASQHVAILRRAGFVKPKRQGKFVHYRVDLERVELINRVIREIND